jgi:hypothetical protein
MSCEKTIEDELKAYLTKQEFVRYFYTLCYYAHGGSKYAIAQYDNRYDYIGVVNHQSLLANLKLDYASRGNKFAYMLMSDIYYQIDDLLNCKIILDQLVIDNFKYAMAGISWLYSYDGQEKKAIKYAIKGMVLGDSYAFAVMAYLYKNDKVGHYYAKESAKLGNHYGYQYLALHYYTAGKWDLCHKYTLKGSNMGNFICSVFLSYIHYNELCQYNMCCSKPKAIEMLSNVFDKGYRMSFIHCTKMAYFHLQRLTDYAISNDKLEILSEWYPKKEDQDKIFKYMMSLKSK